MKQKSLVSHSFKEEFRNISILLVLLMAGAVSWAQEITITGNVTDAESSQPLPGVNVIVKGTSTGVNTDLDGNFEIKVPSKEAVITFSFMGFITQEITVREKTSINVALDLDTESLEEVVVVGCGTQKKVNLSGYVATVDMKKLESRPTANITQRLQGIVANLNITFPSGAPGASAQINIRGSTSINGGKPLILIDGVPSSEADLTRLNPGDVNICISFKRCFFCGNLWCKSSFWSFINYYKNWRQK